MSQSNYQSVLSDLITPLWEHYLSRVPLAHTIHSLLKEHNKRVVHDHIYFRTVNLPQLSGAAMSETLGQYGYCLREHVSCKEQHLELFWLRHPTPELPSVAIGELQPESLSARSRSLIDVSARQLREAGEPLWLLTPSDLPTMHDFQALLSESDIAAWFSVFGNTPRYFSVSGNQLERQNSPQRLIKLLSEEGFPLDHSDGAQPLITNIATMPDQTDVTFSDGETLRVSTGPYHFTFRSKTESGKLYKGLFSEASRKG